MNSNQGPASTADDLRRRATYTPAEVSRYARVSSDTLRAWTKTGLIIASAPTSRTPFSFVNLVEAHVLAALRRIHRLKMSQVRNAVVWLRKGHGLAHPLAELDLETDGHEIFVRFFEVPVSASASGQAAFPQVIDLFLRRIERDEHRLPTRFYPFTYDHCPRIIVIDPAVSSGRPVVEGTSITTIAIFQRYRAGEGLADIARDCGLEMRAVEEAVRCELEHRP